MKDSKGTYRRNGKNVYIKQPELKELDFVSKLWADEETMKEIGGVFNFPESKWDMFYKKMVYPTDGKNFYCLVYNTRDKAVGEVSFHGYDSATRIARFNIKIHHRYRNKGYAEEAIRLLLEYYFLEFGGEVIMDNISTDSGKRVARKLGFEEIRQHKDEITIKITKKDFLNNNKGVSKKVAILIYNQMNMADYAMAHDILNIANEIAEDKVFDIYGVAFEESIVTSNGLTISTNNINLNEDKPDIIIMPSGVMVEEQVRDKEKIKYIMTHFNNCDYICAGGKAIKFLIRCRALEGIFIPKRQVDEEDMQYVKENRLILKNFMDNGKIMLNANTMGELEMLLSLIDKVGGRTLAEKVSKKIGLNK
ncbi:GNAT family N-acetyltransferase [Clostridium paraputrificum]|uniref:GNAT family N-acetyltransferase n=1 Tax=Clostridium paraputrificum TaxID=29363 RepID=UPI003D337281